MIKKECLSHFIKISRRFALPLICGATIMLCTQCASTRQSAKNNGRQTEEVTTREKSDKEKSSIKESSAAIAVPGMEQGPEDTGRKTAPESESSVRERPR